MKIGLIGPDRVEVARVIDALENKTEKTVTSIPVITGQYCGLDIAVGICGMATVHAAVTAEILVLSEGCDTLMLCGVAGGIDPRLEIGDTVICESLAYHDLDGKLLTDDPPYMKSFWIDADLKLVEKAKIALGEEFAGHKVFCGKAVTGDYFVTDDGRAEIIEKFDPLCTDMETAAVAHVAYLAGLPFIALRSITDTATHSGKGTFHEHFVESSETVQKATLAFLEQVAK